MQDDGEQLQPDSEHNAQELQDPEGEEEYLDYGEEPDGHAGEGEQSYGDQQQQQQPADTGDDEERLLDDDQDLDEVPYDDLQGQEEGHGQFEEGDVGYGDEFGEQAEEQGDQQEGQPQRHMNGSGDGAAEPGSDEEDLGKLLEDDEDDAVPTPAVQKQQPKQQPKPQQQQQQTGTKQAVQQKQQGGQQQQQQQKPAGGQSQGKVS